MRGGTRAVVARRWVMPGGAAAWLGATLLFAGLALAAATAALAQAPGASSSSSSGAGGASASASANAGSSSSSSSSSSSAGGGGGQQQQQQQQGGGGVVLVVTGTPVAVPAVAINGGTAGTVVTGNSAVPITQVFTPPQEIILSSQPAQVFTPPGTTQITQVVQTRSTGTGSAGTFAPPPRSGNLPFTGVNTALGLIGGFALICSGALLLVRRRNEALDLALAAQASALRALAGR